MAQIGGTLHDLIEGFLYQEQTEKNVEEFLSLAFGLFGYTTETEIIFNVVSPSFESLLTIYRENFEKANITTKNVPQKHQQPEKKDESKSISKTRDELRNALQKEGKEFATKLLSPVESENTQNRLLNIAQELIATFTDPSKIKEDYQDLFKLCIEINNLRIIRDILENYLKLNPAPAKDELDSLIAKVNQNNQFKANTLANEITLRIQEYQKSPEAKSENIKSQQPTTQQTQVKKPSLQTEDKSRDTKDNMSADEKIKIQLRKIIQQAVPSTYLQSIDTLGKILIEINTENLGFNFQLKTLVKECISAIAKTEGRDNKKFHQILCNLPAGLTSLFLEQAHLLTEQSQEIALMHLRADMRTRLEEEKNDKVETIFTSLIFLKEIQVILNSKRFNGAIQYHTQLKNWFKEKNTSFLKLQDQFFSQFKKANSDNEFQLFAEYVRVYYLNLSNIDEVQYIRKQILEIATANPQDPNISHYSEQICDKLDFAERCLSPAITTIPSQSRESKDIKDPNPTNTSKQLGLGGESKDISVKLNSINGSQLIAIPKPTYEEAVRLLNENQFPAALNIFKKLTPDEKTKYLVVCSTKIDNGFGTLDANTMNSLLDHQIKLQELLANPSPNLSSPSKDKESKLSEKDMLRQQSSATQSPVGISPATFSNLNSQSSGSQLGHTNSQAANTTNNSNNATSNASQSTSGNNSDSTPVVRRG